MNEAALILALTLVWSSAVFAQGRSDTELCRQQLTDGRDAYEGDRWIDAAVFVYAYLVCAERPLPEDLDRQLRLIYEYSYSKAVGQAKGLQMKAQLYVDKPEYPQLP